MIHEFDTIIYPCKIWITYDATVEEIADEFPRGDGNGKVFRSVESYNAYAITDFLQNEDRKYGVLIRFDGKDAMTISNITHESVHAAQHVFNFIGADANDNSGEPFAYLTSFAAKCCEEVLNK